MKSSLGFQKCFLCVILVMASMVFGQGFHLEKVEFFDWSQNGLGDIGLQFDGGKVTLPSKGDIVFEPAVEDCTFRIESWYDYSIRVTGSFKPETHYIVRVKEDYSSRDGVKLGRVNVGRIYLPRMDSLVSLMTQGIVLPLKRKNWTMPLVLRNIGKLTATVERVFENNIVAYDLNEYDMIHTAEPVRKISFPVEIQKNVKTECLASLDDILPSDKPGAYMLRFHGEDEPAPGFHARHDSTSAHLAVVTDLGVTVFHDQALKRLAVCVRTLSGGRAVAKADIRVYSRSNQLIARCKTDGDGMATVPMENAADHDLALPKIVMASAGDDFNFVLLGRHSDASSPHAVELTGQCQGRELQLGAQAFLYFERGVARPGEEIVAAAYVMERTESRFKALENYPCVLEVTNPLGDVIFKKKVKTGKSGFVMQRIDLDSACRTGQYQAVLRIDGGRRLAQAGIVVAAYVPDKIKVDIKADRAVVGLGETAKFKVDAAYYYGASANDLPMTVAWRYGAARDKAWDGYDVGDAEGIAYPQSEDMRFKSVSAARSIEYVCKECTVKYVPMTVTCETSVQVPGGRGVTGRASVQAHFCPWYLGVKALEGGSSARLKYTLFPGASEAQLPTAAVDAVVSISRIDWEYNIVEKSGRYRYEWEQVVKPTGKGGAVKLDPKGGILELGDLDGGRYEVVIAVGDAVRTRSSFWHGEGESGVRGDDPNVLVFKSDRAVYAPGEVATLSFDSSEDGFAVIACGEANLETSRTIAVKEGRNDVKITLPKALMTERYYCCVTAVAGADSKQRRCGVASLQVSQKERRLAVALTAPEIARPGATVDIGIALADPDGKPVAGLAHVFLVDAGVLSLTAYKTPDIFGFCHGPRACGIRLNDVYGVIYPDLVIKNASRIGGDGIDDGSLAKKSGDGGESRSAVVVLDAVEVGADGRGTVTAVIPEHFGAMRVMCVAAAEGRFGSGDAALTVRNAVDVLGAGPRVVAPGDEFELTFQLHNFEVTNNSVFNFAVTIPKGLKALGVVHHAGRLAAGARKVVNVRVKAVEMGVMAIGYDLVIGGERSGRTLSVRVRSGNPPAMECENVVLAPGESRWFAVGRKNWQDGEATACVTASAPAFAGVSDCLDWLNRYPYGCLEQTVSCAFPFLYLPALAASGIVSPEEAETHRHKLSGAVKRMMSMYTGDGRFTLWPGSRDDDRLSDDASLFAAHYLYALNKQQPQDAAVLDKIETKFLVPMMENTSVSRARRGYCAYILSLRSKSAFSGESPAVGAARNVISGEQTDLAAFWASASLVNLGYAAEAMPAFKACLAAKPWLAQESVLGFGCEASRYGMILAVLMEIQPRNPVALELAEGLQGMLRPDGNGYGTTQANAWAVAGLASYGVYHRQTGRKGMASLNGAAAQEWNTEKACRWNLNANDRLSIINTGDTPLFFRFRCEGIRLGELTPVKGVIAVERTYLNRFRTPVLLVRQGDLLTVKLTIRSTRALDSLVFVDMLPGGLEIEDDSLVTRARDENPNAIKMDGASRIVHVDRRDDRMLLFADISEGGFIEYTYKVRAVTRGCYTLCPVTGEAMYQPDINCIQPDGRTLVIE